MTMEKHTKDNNGNHNNHNVHNVGKKQNRLFYGFVRSLSWVVSRVLFKRVVLRNELKGKKGPLVVIANHEAALDFVNLITATREPMHFVISSSFYGLLPCKWLVSRLGLIPKQQFQTSLHDITAMRHTVESGEILVIYPAGLMCEDGVSTPIPDATYKFLKWLKADIYVARTEGTYFCTPKWATARKRRPGRTYIDIYKLYDKDVIADLSEEEIRHGVGEALLFDAYRDQEKRLVKYSGGSDVRGLENVLYLCPHCNAEFTVGVRDRNTLFCSKCGFAQSADDYGFLHKCGEVGEELRYVSDWNSLVLEHERRIIEAGDTPSLTSEVAIKVPNRKKNCFVEGGNATVTLTDTHFHIEGCICGEPLDLKVPIACFASLPFSPGRYFEIQHGDDIFRCYPTDPSLVMKFINRVKIYYEIHTAAHAEE